MFDNIQVQKLPPTITFEGTEDFSDAMADLMFVPEEGNWQIASSRYAGTPTADDDRAVSLVDLGLSNGLQVASILQLNVTLNTDGEGGVVFDYYGPDNFKFAVISTARNQIVIGHYTSKTGWVHDAIFNMTIDAGRDYELAVSLKGTTVNLSVKETGLPNWQGMVGYAFNAVVVDGGFGLLSSSSSGGGSVFDRVTIKTDDSAFLADNLLAVAAPDGVMHGTAALSYDQLDRTVDAAIYRWGEMLSDPVGLDLLDQVTFQIADLDGLVLGHAGSGRIVIDVNAAEYGWFVDETPWDDAEFGILGETGELLADDSSIALGRMDLLTVVMHELGHVLGLEDLNFAGDAGDLMCETLPAGVRRVDAKLALERKPTHNDRSRYLPRVTERNRFLFERWFSNGLRRDEFIICMSDESPMGLSSLGGTGENSRHSARVSRRDVT
jgi:hypothetical protein